MINENFIFLGLTIYICGSLSYLIDTLKGKTKPNRVTFFFWAAAPLIAFAAEVKQGVGIQSLLTFIVGFNPLLILAASFINKNAYWKLHKVDYLCGVLAILGLLFWTISKEPNVAILFAILADLVASIPTLIKINKFPETENIYLYLGAILNGVITLLTIEVWNFEHYAFPVYLVVSAGLIAGLIKWRLYVPNRKQSEFVEEAIIKELNKKNFLAAMKKAKGAWKNHKEDTHKFIRSLRDSKRI